MDQLHHCANIIGRARHRSHRFTFGHGQSKLLWLISRHGGVSQRDLAEMMRIRPASLGELLAKLASGGFVERQTDSEDKRLVNVFLTPKGRHEIADCQDEHEGFAEAIFESFTGDEKAQLSRLLKKLIESIEAKFATPPDEASMGHEYWHHHSAAWRRR
jgi:DNA-binding MarR family transcriptional regulator